MGQFVNFKILRVKLYFLKKLRGQFTFFGIKLKILVNLRTKMQNLKNYNNEEF